MKKKFVEDLMWLDEEEMLNLVAIAQSSPGAVAVNASIIVGHRIAGMPGALLAVLGTVLPPLVILSVISLFYSAFRSNEIVSVVLKGMQSGVAAVIADVVISMGGKIIKERSLFSMLIMAGAFAATFVLKINIVFIILTSGIIGALQVFMMLRDRKEHKRL